jgi:hypothetical protein
MSSKLTPQDRAIKVLVKLIKSHQAILGLVRQNPACPVNLREADEAIEGAGRLLNDLRLGEIKVERWIPTTILWCVECGNSWTGDVGGEECPECGGQCSDT